MKKILIPALFALLLAGCSPANNKAGCAFNRADITMGSVDSDTPTEQYSIGDCFKRSAPNANGLTEIKGDKTAQTFTTLYNDPSTGISKLTFKFKDNSSDWNTDKGHEIMKVEYTDSLKFIFVDRKVSRVKGSVVFVK
jgi:hypothetical protein